MTLKIDLDIVKQYTERLEKLLEIKSNPNISSLEKDIIAETEREHILAEYCQYFGRSLEKNINKHLDRLEKGDIKVSEDDSIYLDEFLKRDFSVYWLCLRYIVRGDLMYLVAPKKAGKSSIFNYLIKSVTYTGEFLGYPCITGKVLYVAAEESNISLKIKASTYGFDNEDVLEEITTNKSVKILRSLDLVNDVAKLEREIKEYKPVLVIVDTARAVMMNATCSENQAEWANPFYKLQALAIKFNCTVLVSHHTNKKNEASGTSALLGVGAGYIMLDSDKEKGTSTLQFITRDLSERTYLVKRVRNEKGEMGYRLEKEFGLTQEQEELQGKILRYILNTKGHTSLTKLKEVFNEPDLVDTIGNLLEVCLIQYTAKKDDVYYYIPDTNKYLLKKIEKYRTLEEDVEVSNKLIELETDEEVKLFTKEWTADYKRKIWGLLPDNDKFRVLLVLKKPKYDKQQVIYNNNSYLAEVQDYNKEDYNFMYKLSNNTEVLNLIDEKKITVT
jgi:KaiC/GvpD/RAD55 family RecA-like ATPase